ncbi:MAG: ABC transporter ATP-binding protein [Chloroflexi bacterium]|nr:ABC transporter ATP-binding protein [Chloroflexota bacterium]
MRTQQGEFSVENAYSYTTTTTFRWIMSHIWRYRVLLIFALLMFIIGWAAFGGASVLIGEAGQAIITGSDALVSITFLVLLVLMMDGVASLLNALSIETIAQRLARDVREELYVSLLGKSQTFHDQQRVGDIMARATDDVQQLNVMVSPGVLFITEIVLGLAVPILYIALIQWQLLLVPALFVVSYVLVVRWYANQLDPVIREQRLAFGEMNAGLEETISGIEIVKASASEKFERKKFYEAAKRYRDTFAQQGRVEARYFPTLFFAFALGFTFLHSMVLFNDGTITLGNVIAVMGLVGSMRFPIFVSLFAFSLVQLGFASADRILHLIKAEAELDENAAGHAAPVVGNIRFENVSFAYDDNPVLTDLNFEIKAGETVAIVGQTGAGKSTLTELINRTYDVKSGCLYIDDVHVEHWNLTSLRSQISRIEQDVFLFSRTIAENIAFGAPEATQEQIEQAAKEAQAHDFILSFAEGYQTTVGERGVTLSGGQRQRIALARAFLSDPRILILDDSTSAIDSATEDEIQKAIRRAQSGRTTVLITHRLSQIRWADHILVLDNGRMVAFGDHETLLRTCGLYRRIFVRYETELPPLEMAAD